MIRKNTWILLAAFVIVLAGYLLWGSVGSDISSVEVTPSPEPLWTVLSEEIVGLVVEDLEADLVLELHRDEEELWRAVEPELEPVDAARVERAVSWLASPSPRAEIADATDLTAFRLDPPLYRIELLLMDGTRLSFQAGRESPTGGSRYVSVSDRPGVFTFSNYGLDEVLTLREDLLATPTAEAPPIDASETPMEGTEQPADDADVGAEDSTPEPGSGEG